MEIALGRIIAGALVFIDEIMSCFVDVDFTAGTLQCNVYGCGGVQYAGGLTACGTYVVDQLVVAIASIMGLAGNVLPALGIQNNSGL